VSWENVRKVFWLRERLRNHLVSPARKPLWRDGAMTPTRRPLTLLSDHLAQLSRSKDGDLALARFVGAGLDPGGAGDLGALLLQCEGPHGNLRRAQLLGALTLLAPCCQVATLCVLVALKPELRWMCRRLTQGGYELEEAEAETVTVAWEVVRGHRDLGRCQSGPSALINAIWTETRRSTGVRRRSLIDLVPWPEALDLAAPDTDPLERWPGLLAAAVAAGVLTPRQVVVIAQSRMDGRPLDEIAASLGRRYGTVHQERRRAEAALRDFALSYYSGSR
jgi:DNA-directed RNA polymerase specialized sigma24 family protein